MARPAIQVTRIDGKTLRIHGVGSVTQHEASGHVSNFSPDKRWFTLQQDGYGYVFRNTDTPELESWEPLGRKSNWLLDSTLWYLDWVRGSVVAVNPEDGTPHRSWPVPREVMNGGWIARSQFSTWTNYPWLNVEGLRMVMLDTLMGEWSPLYVMDPSREGWISNRESYVFADGRFLLTSGKKRQADPNGWLTWNGMRPAVYQEKAFKGWSHPAFDPMTGEWAGSHGDVVALGRWGMDPDVHIAEIVPEGGRHQHGCLRNGKYVFSTLDPTNSFDNGIWLWDTVAGPQRKIADLPGHFGNTSFSRWASPAHDGKRALWTQVNPETSLLEVWMRDLDAEPDDDGGGNGDEPTDLESRVERLERGYLAMLERVKGTESKLEGLQFDQAALGRFATRITEAESKLAELGESTAVALEILRDEQKTIKERLDRPVRR